MNGYLWLFQGQVTIRNPLQCVNFSLFVLLISLQPYMPQFLSVSPSSMKMHYQNLGVLRLVTLYVVYFVAEGERIGTKVKRSSDTSS